MIPEDTHFTRRYFRFTKRTGSANETLRSLGGHGKAGLRINMECTLEIKWRWPLACIRLVNEVFTSTNP